MESQEKVSTRVAKNSILLVVRMIIVMVISIFTTRFLLTNLGVEDYGVYNVTIGIVAICTFLSPALSNANQRYHNFELGKNGVDGACRVFNSGVRIQLLMVCAIVIIAETIGLWYIKEKLVIPDGREWAVFWVYQVSVVAFSISMLQVPLISAVLAHERMSFYAIVNLFDAIMKLLIAIGIAHSNHDKLVVYSLLLLFITICNLLIYYIYARFQFKEVRLKRTIDKNLLRNMLSFSGWNLFETIARIGKDQGCNLLLNFFCGPILNAARGVASQVTYAFSSVVDSTMMASRPQMVSSYAKGDVHTTLSMFYTLSKGTLLIIFALSLPVFLEVDFILRLWLGTSVPEYTAHLVRISIFIVLVDKLSTPVTALIHATGSIKWYHLTSSIINILVIPLAWGMLNLGYGPTSVYYVTLFGVVFAQVFFLFIIRKQTGVSIRTYLKIVCLPFFVVVISSVIIPALIVIVVKEGMARLLLVLTISELLVLFFTYLWGLTDIEKGVIKRMMRNIKS